MHQPRAGWMRFSSPHRSSQHILHTYVALIHFDTKKPGFFEKPGFYQSSTRRNQPPNGFATLNMPCIRALTLPLIREPTCCQLVCRHCLPTTGNDFTTFGKNENRFPPALTLPKPMNTLRPEIADTLSESGGF
jgi:hypothetical protein